MNFLCKILSLIVLLFIQSINSLSAFTQGKNILDSIHADSASINKLIDKAFTLTYENPDSAFLYANVALNEAKKIEYIKGIGDALQTKGIIYYAIDHYDSALNYFFSALDYHKTRNDLRGIASTYNNIALSYTNLSIYKSAVNFNLEALKIWEDIKEDAGLSKSYNNLGICYQNLKDYKKALEYYSKALNLKKLSKDTSAIASTLNNIGQLYFDWGYESDIYKDSAQSYFISAITLRDKIHDKHGLSESLLNLGNVFIQQKQFARAQIFIDDAIQNFMQTDNKYGLATAYFNKGFIYYNLPNPEMDKSFDEFSKSLKISEEIKSLELIRDNYQNLSELFKRTKNFNKAYQYLELYNQYKDSVISTDTKKEVTRLQVEYELQKKEKTILKQEVTINNLLTRQTKFIIFISIFALILIIALIIIRKLISANIKRRY